MKLFSQEHIRILDTLTIERQKISSLDLMERAAGKAFEWLQKTFPDKERIIHIFCGVGNNGGDGLVLARLFSQKEFKAHVYIVPFSEQFSEDFQENLHRIETEGINLSRIKDVTNIPQIADNDLIIDAIFGTGLSREPEAWIQDIFEHISIQKAVCISIDIPSGLFMDRPTRKAVRSDITLSFQFPKAVFYLPDSAPFVKQIVILDIGLDKQAEEALPEAACLIDEPELRKIYRPLNPLTHKGRRGHSVIIGGSYGKMGAVVLAAKGALRSGCGLVSAFIPSCGYTVLQTAFPEAMVLSDTNSNYISNIDLNFNPDAIGIGVGMGQETVVQEALFSFLKKQNLPLVLDADALNCLSAQPQYLSDVPKGSILTPHPKELQRLVGEWKDDFEKLERVRELSKKTGTIIIIKGAYTWIVEKERCFINGTANPALATGGSGDVLTGILTGLLAQGYAPVETAILGVYLHGLSATIGTQSKAPESFIASDIIENMGKAFLQIASCKTKD